MQILYIKFGKYCIKCCANIVQNIVRSLFKYCETKNIGQYHTNTNIVQVLYKCCTNIEQILYNYCANIVQNVVWIMYKILCEYCLNIVKISLKNKLANIRQILYIYCANILQTFCRYCKYTVEIIYKHCANIEQILQNYCTNIVQKNYISFIYSTIAV